MLKHRIISFVGLLAVFGVIVFWQPGGRWLFAVAGTLIVFQLVREGLILLKRVGLETFPFEAACVSAVAFALLSLTMARAQLFPFLFWPLVAVLVAVLYFPFLLLLGKNRSAAITAGAVGSLGGLALLLLPVCLLARVYWLEPKWFLFLVLVTKMTDTGGYIVGMISGKILPGGNHKIVPQLSPKKSWEGTFGGVLFAILAGWILARLGFAPVPPQPGVLGAYPLWYILLAAALLGLGSFAGDLTESALKRQAQVKDSANIIPGMGGAFDVFDSFIFNGLLFTLLFQV